MKNCIRCGAALEDLDEQCRYCGKILSDDENVSNTQSEQSYQPPRYPDPPVYGAPAGQQAVHNQPPYQSPQPPQYQPPNFQQPYYQQQGYQSSTQEPPPTYQQQYNPQAYPPGYDPRAPHGYNYFYYNDKSKVAAGLFGIFLGGFGVHKFYLGNIGLGIVYILFSWSFIPSIIGIIEGIVYLTMDEYAFREKYCKIFR